MYSLQLRLITHRVAHTIARFARLCRTPACVRHLLSSTAFLPLQSCSTPGLNLGSAVLTVHDSKEYPPIVRSSNSRARLPSSLLGHHHVRVCCNCESCLVRICCRFESCLTLFSVNPITMPLSEGRQGQGDAAPVRREETTTYVPQVLLGQLGQGTTDPEALDAQGVEEVELRETPELFSKFTMYVSFSEPT